jgi:cytochrome c biogenesis protein CcdA/thiol-disulfide isomerase/thioredoxin
MDAVLTNIGMAFQAGLPLNQASYILLILLILFCGALTGNNQRPVGMTIGFVISYACFTLFSRKLVDTVGLDLDIYRFCAFALIGLFGLLMLSDHLHKKCNHLIQVFVGINENNLTPNRNSFGIAFILGALVAVAWTPVSNPLLNAVIVQITLQKISVSSFFILIAFALGTITPILLIAIFGRIIIFKMSWLKDHAHLIHKICGLIILCSIIFIGYHYTYSAPVFTVDKNGELAYQSAIIDGVTKPYPTPNLDGITAWLNASPLTQNDLQGKVVLVYFWTYSCIHCLHSLPHIISWYNDYRDNGLLIIGVHTPEFDFEKSLLHVAQAVSKLKISFPVAIDNNFVSWQNFQAKSWPTYYLIDKAGNVVYQHIGEGDYTTLENNIRYLLGFNTIAAENIDTENSPVLSAGVTPETHFGIDHSKTYGGLIPLDKDTIKDYAFPPVLTETSWALSGKWSILANNITAMSANAAIKIRFHSKQVFAIMGMHNNRKIAVRILLDNKPVSVGAGNAMTNSVVDVDSPGLYEILTLSKPTSGELELVVPTGFELYTLSFDDPSSS